MMLERREGILKAVVEEFTITGLPVGSQALAARHFMTVSAATIRNELAALVDLGYLLQPHVSAGRVPSDRGYRYFVDFLMAAEPAPPGVRRVVDTALRATPADIQALVERLAALVAMLTENAAVVTAPQGSRATVKHVSLASLDDHTALLVLLLEGNVLRQQVITVSEPASQEDLSRLEARINRNFAGCDRDQVGRRMEKLAVGPDREVIRHLDDLLRTFEAGSDTMVVHDGVRNLLRHPEFTDSTRLQEVLELLEETRLLGRLLGELSGEGDVQIVIGTENPTTQLRHCAMVLTTYGPSGHLKGVLGVVGPTRMRYADIIGRLRLVADAATVRISDLAQ